MTTNITASKNIKINPFLSLVNTLLFFNAESYIFAAKLSYWNSKIMYCKAKQFIAKSLPVGKNLWINQFIFKALYGKGKKTSSKENVLLWGKYFFI